MFSFLWEARAPTGVFTALLNGGSYGVQLIDHAVLVCTQCVVETHTGIQTRNGCQTRRVSGIIAVRGKMIEQDLFLY